MMDWPHPERRPTIAQVEAKSMAVVAGLYAAIHAERGVCGIKVKGSKTKRIKWKASLGAADALRAMRETGDDKVWDRDAVPGSVQKVLALMAEWQPKQED